MSTDKQRLVWSVHEIELVVLDYFEMLRLELLGTSFNRAERNRQLQVITGRSKGSIEFKRQNISAVLEVLGIPWLKGFVPLRNFQGALLDCIESYLERDKEILVPNILRQSHGLSEAQEVYFEEPPNKLAVLTERETTERVRLLIQKFDPAKRDSRNRELGIAGEKLIFELERSRVERENPDLAKSVKWISREIGDGAGFDILSFDQHRRERLIEVKTTTGGQRTPFYISANEVAVARRNSDNYSILRIYDFARSPRAFELRTPIEECVSLTAINYRASFE